MQEEIEKRLIDGFLSLMLEIRSVGKIQFYACLNRHDSMYFKKYFEYIKENHEEFYPLLCSNYSNGFSTRFARAIMNTRLETRKAWKIDVSPEPKELSLREDILSSLYVSLFFLLAEKQYGNIRRENVPAAHQSLGTHQEI